MSDIATAAESGHTTPPNGEPLMEVRDLVKHFPLTSGIIFQRKIGAVQAVDGVSFDVLRGETLGLVGESGCGKSTTARLLLRLMEPTSGSIRFEGEEISGASGARLKKLRQDMQMIFQDPYSSLNPRKTVGTIIGEPFAIQKLHKGEGERKKTVQELMDLVGLNPEHYNRYPHEFSGGQRQRIGVARALALKPKVIVADEPVSALDVSIQAQILNLLRELQREFDRRAGDVRAALRAPADALHRRADVRGAGGRPAAGGRQEAPGAGRRRAVADQSAARLPLPHALLEGAGDLPHGRSAARGEGGRQPGRLPLPAHRRRGRRAGSQLPPGRVALSARSSPGPA
jgi:peptide/nickel transport system ATP-binding protein/oligopeptide transport system ATP-binding protein